MEKIIFIIIKIIKKIFIWIFAIILFFILIRTIRVFIINPYKIKTEIIEEYKNSNVLLKRSDMRIGYSSGFLPIFDNRYWLKIVNPKQFKNKLFDIKYNKYGTCLYGLHELEYYPNIFYYSQVNYVISNRINDKSKGNDFEKIEEIIDKKSKEILNKGFYHSEYDKNSKFRLAVEILFPTNKEYEGNRVYTSGGYSKYILNEDKTMIIKIPVENTDYEVYEKKFEEMTRYTEIDWEEYMKENKSLVFLIPYELSNNSFGLKYYEDEKEDKESVEYLMKLFKEFEKYYNKDTYRFAVLKWGIKE